MKDGSTSRPTLNLRVRCFTATPLEARITLPVTTAVTHMQFLANDFVGTEIVFAQHVGNIGEGGHYALLLEIHHGR